MQGVWLSGTSDQAPGLRQLRGERRPLVGGDPASGTVLGEPVLGDHIEVLVHVLVLVALVVEAALDLAEEAVAAVGLGR